MMRRKIKVSRASCHLLLSLGVLLVVSRAVLAGDTVVYKTGPREQDTTRKSGEILDYTGRELLLRQTNGRELSIEAAQIIRVTTPLTARQMAADQQYRQRQYQQASALYDQAVRDEPRTWVRRQILARQVWCQRSLNQHAAAIESFLVVLGSDPTSQYFDAIPLAWTTQQPSPALERRALGWLDDKEPAAARLIAASWLLPTASRGAAIETLQRLAGEQDSRIALLAAAQLWRTQLVTATDVDVQRWRQTFERIPAKLRAGPSYVLGLALSRRGAHEDAALYLMRVPILFPAHRRLSMESLYTAARELEAIGQNLEARQLYSEVIAEFPDSSRAGQAQQRVSALPQANH